MITGDYPAMAHAIVHQAGLDDGGAVLSGEMMEKLAGRDLQGARADSDGFCTHHAGTKAAHRSSAQGGWRNRRGRGTDVAREASAIVLLDDGSIVTAVRLGRRIYDNLRKAMGFIFAVHVPIAGLALLPLILGLPIIFSPIHIAFL